MGVPSFYRWLVNNAVEERVKVEDDNLADKIDTSLSNPNGIEFDNLYLDMNGIIHPCFHPEGDYPPPPETYEDVFNNIFDYIDRLFGIVRPRKLIYMAIDGVAPRAKMNQQRTRRFRTAKDIELTDSQEERLRYEFEMDGKHVLPKQESELSDSNIITPGTAFMHELSKALQSYVNSRLKDDIGWKNIKVIISDANVPGEGEHKIMSFIREQRSSPGYIPNTRHCIYGLDADLIMLVLATHEVHFSILREDVLKSEQLIYQSSLTPITLGEKPSLLNNKEVFKCRRMKPYQFLHAWILREYLELDMQVVDPPGNMKIDLERIIDDFIFVCFFTGNDFLPHIPSIEIHEGAIDLLMYVYKHESKKFGGYLVDTQFADDSDMPYIHLKRVEKFILSVGQREELIFKKRTELRDHKLRRLLSECSRAQQEDGDQFPGQITSSVRKPSAVAVSDQTNCSASSYCQILENTNELKDKLKCWSRDRLDLFKDGSFFVDKVKFGAPGWKQRYYKEKFCAETELDVENIRKSLVEKYTEGLCWVLLYYFSGVPSWNWFYPFHYGPLASELRGASQVKVNFQKGLPFKPFDQLMGVLPPRSCHALPKPYRDLMTSEDSKILDFYPLDFEIDTDGKRFLWQGICKLPFIDENRLTAETKDLEQELLNDERVRNSIQKDLLLVRRQKQPRIGESNLRCGIEGFNSLLNDAFASLTLAEANCFKDFKDIKNDVICVRIEPPNSVKHVPRLLEKVILPDKIIFESDIMETKLWHECLGGGPRPQYQEFSRRITDVGKSNDRADEVVHKGVGIGRWSPAGRGKQSNPNTESSGYSNKYVGYRKGENHHSQGCGYNRPFQVGRGEGAGSSSPVSYSRQSYKSYGRAREPNDNFWPHSNVVADNIFKEHRRIGNSGATSGQGWNATSMGRAQGRGRAGSYGNAASTHWRVKDDVIPSIRRK